MPTDVYRRPGYRSVGYAPRNDRCAHCRSGQRR